MTLSERIERFFDGAPHAVVGASADRTKYGNRVLRAYLQQGRRVFPVNPRADEVAGLEAYPTLCSLPEPVHGVSIVTPPDVTESIVEEAAEIEVEHLWMQPGCDSPRAVERARQLKMNVIFGGPCVLVTLGYGEKD